MIGFVGLRPCLCIVLQKKSLSVGHDLFILLLHYSVDSITEDQIVHRWRILVALQLVYHFRKSKSHFSQLEYKKNSLSIHERETRCIEMYKESSTLRLP